MEKKKITNSMRTLGSTSITKADREENGSKQTRFI